MCAGLFVLALAVFQWGLHSRLTQYKAGQHDSGGPPVAKVWLEDRCHRAVEVTGHAVFPALAVCVPMHLGWSIPAPGLGLIAQGKQPKGRVGRLQLWTHGHALFFRPPPSNPLYA
jgi:hypothetical protein